MSRSQHIPVAPIAALRRTADGRTRWIAVDPGLRADCIAAYRSCRLLILSLIAFIAGPVRAHGAAGRPNKISSIEIARQKNAELKSVSGLPGAMAVARPLSISARKHSAQRIAPASTREFYSDKKPQLIDLKANRAHGPPAEEKPVYTAAVQFCSRNPSLICSSSFCSSFYRFDHFFPANSVLTFVAVRPQAQPCLFIPWLQSIYFTSQGDFYVSE